jgi:predicted small lipoprotein YifL
MAQGRTWTAGIVSAGFAALLLAACGQKGPLYVPGVPKQASWPYPRPAPSATRPEAERRVPDVPATSEPDR